MFSYTSMIINCLLGSAKSNSPFEDINIHQTNSKNLSIIVANNALENDHNLYELKVENNDQFKLLQDICLSDEKIKNICVKNNYTYNGQYLEIIVNQQSVNINISVLSYKMKVLQSF